MIKRLVVRKADALVDMGRPILARLEADSRLAEAAASMKTTQTALEPRVDALNAAWAAEQLARIQRDEERRQLNAEVREFAFIILSGNGNHHNADPYLRYFPEGVAPVVNAPLENELVKVGSILSKLAEEEDWVGSIDVTRGFYRDTSFSGLWKFGLKGRVKTKTSDYEVFEYSPEEDVLLTDYLSTWKPDTTYIDGRYTMGPFPDPGKLRALLASGTLSGERVLEEDLADHTIDENSLAAYVMTSMEFGSNVTLLAGVRGERTNTKFKASELIYDADGNPTLFCGTSGGVLRTFAAAAGKGLKQAWLADLGSEVTGLAVIADPEAGEDLLVAGSASASLVAFREDGRVYWLPPQSLTEVRRLQGFLNDVGMTLVVAEVEAETTGAVTEVVSESVADQVHKLTLEVAEFDGTQKPSTYVRRLEEYQSLRGKCVLYRDALGVGVDEAERALTELEGKVEAMLNVRTKSVVHRDGSMDTPKAAPTAITSLKFAGATFTATETQESDELLFVSGAAAAISAVKALEAMGLAGRWQKAGGVEVNVQNSGPKGAETSIRVRGTSGVEVATVGRALAGMGIEVGG